MKSRIQRPAIVSGQSLVGILPPHDSRATSSAMMHRIESNADRERMWQLLAMGDQPRVPVNLMGRNTFCSNQGEIKENLWPL
jgi:hypothetical protein